MTNNRPKVFVSYSWTSPDHEEWVLNFANELTDNAIHVIIDKWDLLDGQDKYAFMEQMVTNPSIPKVALIFDKGYVERANNRSGGVGTETQILTYELYEQVSQDKFVGIIAERDENGRLYAPAYYKSRMYIDLSDDEKYTANFERVLRWVYNKPVYTRPQLGEPPEFLADTPGVSLGTNTAYRHALEAIRQGRPYAIGAVSEYFKLVSRNLERFRIESATAQTMVDAILNSIKEMLNPRNEIAKLMLAIAQYSRSSDMKQVIHRFFEDITVYFERDRSTSRFFEWQFDNHKFLTYELFLYCIACLVKYDAFDAIGYLVRQNYMTKPAFRDDTSSMRSFSTFHRTLDSLDEWNRQHGSRMYSPLASLLHERGDIDDISFEDIMQADTILFIRSLVDDRQGRNAQGWYPETLRFAEMRRNAFPVFMRAESLQYYKRLAEMFDGTSIEEINSILSDQAYPWVQTLGIHRLANRGRLGIRP